MSNLFLHIAPHANQLVLQYSGCSQIPAVSKQWNGAYVQFFSKDFDSELASLVEKKFPPNKREQKMTQYLQLKKRYERQSPRRWDVFHCLQSFHVRFVKDWIQIERKANSFFWLRQSPPRGLVDNLLEVTKVSDLDRELLNVEDEPSLVRSRKIFYVQDLIKEGSLEEAISVLEAFDSNDLEATSLRVQIIQAFMRINNSERANVELSELFNNICLINVEKINQVLIQDRLLSFSEDAVIKSC